MFVLAAMSFVIRHILGRQHRPLEALLRTGVPTDAAVVALESRSSAGHRVTHSMATLYFPVVRFRGPTGEVESALQIGASIPPARVGEIISVRYDPDNPARVIGAHGGLTSPRAMSCLARILAFVPALMAVLVLLAWALLKSVFHVPG